MVLISYMWVRVYYSFNSFNFDPLIWFLFHMGVILAALSFSLILIYYLEGKRGVAPLVLYCVFWLSLILRLGPTLQYPLLFSADTWIHLGIEEALLNNGFKLPIYNMTWARDISRTPFMHYLVAWTCSLSGLKVDLVARFLPPVIGALAIVAVFLVSRNVFSVDVAVLSSFILAVGEVFVWQTTRSIPETIGHTVNLFAIYFLIKIVSGRRKALSTVFFLLLASIETLNHPLSTFFLLTVTVGSLFFTQLFELLSSDRYLPNPFYLVIILFSSFFTGLWWYMYPASIVQLSADVIVFGTPLRYVLDANTPLIFLLMPLVMVSPLILTPLIKFLVEKTFVYSFFRERKLLLLQLLVVIGGLMAFKAGVMTFSLRFLLLILSLTAFLEFSKRGIGKLEVFVFSWLYVLLSSCAVLALFSNALGINLLERHVAFIFEPLSILSSFTALNVFKRRKQFSLLFISGLLVTAYIGSEIMYIGKPHLVNRPSEVEACKWLANTTSRGDIVVSDGRLSAVVFAVTGRHAISSVAGHVTLIEQIYTSNLSKTLLEVKSGLGGTYILTSKLFNKYSAIGINGPVKVPNASIYKFDDSPVFSRVYDNGLTHIYKVKIGIGKIEWWGVDREVVKPSDSLLVHWAVRNTGNINLSGAVVKVSFVKRINPWKTKTILNESIKINLAVDGVEKGVFNISVPQNLSGGTYQLYIYTFSDEQVKKPMWMEGPIYIHVKWS